MFNNFEVSNIADWLQIITFAFSVGTIVIASISKRIRLWIKSIIMECLREFFKNLRK